jgi:SNF2 family DNA or RNA helicase
MNIEIKGTSLAWSENGQELGLDELAEIVRSQGNLSILVSGRPITFSRTVAELSVMVTVEGNSVFCEFLAKFRGNAQKVQTGAKGVILADRWHPIRESDFSRILEQLSDAGFNFMDPNLKDALAVNGLAENLTFDFRLNFLRDSRAFVRPSLAIEPYPYQLDGIKYFSSLYSRIPGAVLADEMGLGKTLQAIGLILHVQSSGDPGPHMVLAPASLLENWSREFLKFAPTLKVQKRVKENRTFEPGAYEKVDVVISSYEVLVNDIGYLNTIDWGIVVADEAQYIKNPSAVRTLRANQLKRTFALAVSGTPFENHMTDIWSITNFVFPGYLGVLEDFIKSHPDSIETARKLEPRLAPVMLRRRVRDVQKDLPDRIDSTLVLEPPSDVLARQAEILGDKSMPLVGKLTNLRTSAAHAVGTYGDFLLSPKFERIRALLDSAYQNSERSLIFASFNQTAAFLARALKEFWPNAYVDCINGDSPADNRQTQVDDFAKAGAGSLILNPKAAGVGLNITAARHVIHMNPEWNPSLTEQASKRAHRSGQTETVFVHYLGYSGTIEDYIFDTQAFKQAIGATVAPGVELPLSVEAALKKLSARPGGLSEDNF